MLFAKINAMLDSLLMMIAHVNNVIELAQLAQKEIFNHVKDAMKDSYSMEQHVNLDVLLANI
jgi:hypothetical protein